MILYIFYKKLQSSCSLLLMSCRTLYTTVSTPPGGSILQCSQYKMHTRLFSAGSTQPRTRCWSVFSFFGSWWSTFIFIWSRGWKLIPPHPPPVQVPRSAVSSPYYFLCDPIMTFETKLTIALAGCSGSCSANRWHMFSVSLWDFLATNPKIFAVELLPLVHFLPCGSREQKMTVLTA